MTVTKYSRQREAIKTYLSQTKSHPTADMVYFEVRKEYPNISLGTVYRNLNFLSDQGEIIKLSCGDGYDRFDGTTDPHYHFICTQCHQVFDLEMDSIESINEIASAHFPGKIEGHKAYFYGLCEQCLSHSHE